MKKVLLIEVAVLLILLLVSVVVCISLGSGEAAPAMQTDPIINTTTQPTEQTTEATTEPQPTWMTFPEGRELLAQQYFVYDCAEEKFLTISGEESERIYPASVTKLFTAYVAMQYLEPDELIIAGNELDHVVWGSSVAGINKGDVLSAEQLVEAMLLPSGNDAAYVLARAAGRKIMGNGSYQYQGNLPIEVGVFMQEMNAHAQRMGMTGTHFSNPDGIHNDEHYTTFADLALLGKLSLENPTVLKYAQVSKQTVTLSEGAEPAEWKNTNALIDPESEYYCPYAIGLKTGQTPRAGSCLLSAFDYEGRKLIIGVFGCPEVEDRFADTLQLFTETIQA